MDTVILNSVTYTIINRNESKDARKIDATCKNKRKCSWLEEKYEHGKYLSTYVTKINVSGSAFCIYCNKPLVYDNTGKKDLHEHDTKSTEHLSSKKNYLSITLLPLNWRKPTINSSSEISTYALFGTWGYNVLWCSRKCPHHCGMPFVEREHFASYSKCFRSKTSS